MSRERAIEVLERMAELAEAGGAPQAARALVTTAAQVAHDPAEGARAINAMFGGAGSLNDIVLYRDGQPLAAENAEFDALRSELFDLALALRGAA